MQDHANGTRPAERQLHPQGPAEVGQEATDRVESRSRTAVSVDLIVYETENARTVRAAETRVDSVRALMALRQLVDPQLFKFLVAEYLGVVDQL